VIYFNISAFILMPSQKKKSRLAGQSGRGK